MAPDCACEAFVSAPIKLAAKITEAGRLGGRQSHRQAGHAPARRNWPAAAGWCLGLSLGLASLVGPARGQMSFPNSQLISAQHHEWPGRAQLRHQAHYLDFVPSVHFSYQEGRQAGGRSLEAPELDTPQQLAAAASGPAPMSHIYKRSSAAFVGPVAGGGVAVAATASHQQLVGSSRASLNPLSRRMMGAPGAEARQASWLGVAGSDEPQQTAEDGHEEQQKEQQQRQQLLSHNNWKQSEHERELLRQKQHIQYHDQWPSVAGKCHKRTLNFCASVLPFNTTTFPNIIGDTNRFEVKRSLPFFGFLAKSSCNKRLDELLCLLLEPPCLASAGAPIPPCKKFCRLALEGCNEYIPATLALSSVFDCRQYPDSNDPSVCVNLAQGSKCASDEFKCPDKTCIPRNWLCDGVRDCIFAADEANCTGAQVSVCSTEEFKCDGKCVPKAWKCDGERDCLDGSDEAECDLRPRCGRDRFKCHDGNGCIPQRWVCDGKAECRDGSDETNCEQRHCSDHDFKCDNGICIPKLWRCDGQRDCRDGSDERQCVYTTPTPSTVRTAGTVSTVWPADSSREQADGQLVNTTAQLVVQREPSEQQELELNLGGDVSRIIQHEQQVAAAGAASPLAPATSSHAPSTTTGATSTTSTTSTTMAATSAEPSETTARQAVSSAGVDSVAELETSGAARELKKLDYELLASSATTNELTAPLAEPSRRLPEAPRVASEQAAGPSAGQARHQRLPIYRSLFKSLKGGQPGAPSERRNVVAIARRRRDRQQAGQAHQRLPAAPSQEPGQPPSLEANQAGLRPQGSRAQLSAQQQQQAGAAVASYLQLLNSRYNLRLPRVVA